jgi:hypothetical protein
MATSPNYGWLEPDNTDLVKNGALAIRTLGNAIDTTMATMVPKSMGDAKGDLIAGTAADTAARLAVGNNGETLVADSSTSTGLRYTAGTVQSNPVLNSAFQVWQRGTANVTTTIAYTADRWQKGGATHFGVSRQVTGDTTNLPNIQYCARVQRTAASATTSNMDINQSFETINSIPFVGKTVTFSFYARAGANYSATSNLLNGTIYTGTGTDQNLIATYTGAATPISVNATLTTTWQRFSGTGTISSSATEMAVYIQGTPTGTAGANDYYEVTGVQIDIGSVALPFRTYAGTIQGELAACQRYFVNFIPSTADYGTVISMFQAVSTTAAKGGLQFPVPMRTSASLTFSTAGNFTLANSAYTPIGVSSISYAVANSTSCRIDMSVASGLVAGNATALSGNNANLLAQASAEL